MKRLFTFFLAMLIASCCTFFDTSAILDSNSVYSIKYFDDGSYLVTSIIQDDVSIFATNTKTSSKKNEYFNSSGELMWDAIITGTFVYTGTTSTCTSSSITYNVHNSNWKITSATSAESGNKAIGYITAKRYFVGIPVQTVEETITLTCSADGTLS